MSSSLSYLCHVDVSMLVDITEVCSLQSGEANVWLSRDEEKMKEAARQAALAREEEARRLERAAEEKLRQETLAKEEKARAAARAQRFEVSLLWTFGVDSILGSLLFELLVQLLINAVLS